MSSTNITPDDVPPLSEQENPPVFDGDIEALNEQAPPLNEQGQKTDYDDGGQGLHKTSQTFGTVYSDQATDGAGHGPTDFADSDDTLATDDTPAADERGDDASGDDAGKAKSGQGGKSRTVRK